MKVIREKKLKKLRNMFLTGLTLALLSQPVIAEAKKWTFNEEKWKDVKAYGRTIISEDSAREWGPWVEFVQPAAGPVPLVVLPEMPTEGSQYFRPESADEYSKKFTETPVVQPPTPPVEGACGAGAWCGYATYEYQEYEGEGYGHYGPYPGKIALRLTPDDPNTVTVEGGQGEGIVSYTVTDLAGNPVHESGDMDADFNDGLCDFSADRGSYYDPPYDDIDSYPPYDITTWNAIPGGQATAGWFRYWDENSNYWDGAHVAGITTPLTDIANLQAGNVTADYYGRTFDSWTPVQITVNFGPGTWSGSWNGGVDGGTWTSTDDSGTKYVRGDVGFNASGTIDGANIQSTSVTAGDGTISGQVQGSFFGDNAAALGGVVDITKTTEGYENARHVDVFITCKGTECGAND